MTFAGLKSIHISRMTKTAIVTGAGGGLGQEVVSGLSRMGFRVIAIDSSEFNDEVFPGPGSVEFYVEDISEHKAVQRLAESLQLQVEGLDLLVCLAGIYETYPVTEYAPESYHRMMGVNFLSVSYLTQAFLRPLITKQGRVVVVSSESHKIQAMFQPYMISKAALEAYCRVAWQELSLRGVKLIVIRPGAIKTPLLKWMQDTEIPFGSVYAEEFTVSRRESVKLVGRISHPAEVAGKILKAVQAKNPKRVYRINNNPLLTLIALLPSGWLDYLIVKRIGNKV